MKKSVVFFLLLSGCQSSVQENKKLMAFRSCHTLYATGTREFENCMKEQEDRERYNRFQERKDLMNLQGGRDVVRGKQAETEPKKTPWKHSLTIPSF